jgi:hypothetical protein
MEPHCHPRPVSLCPNARDLADHLGFAANHSSRARRTLLDAAMAPYECPVWEYAHNLLSHVLPSRFSIAAVAEKDDVCVQQWAVVVQEGDLSRWLPLLLLIIRTLYFIIELLRQLTGLCEGLS